MDLTIGGWLDAMKYNPTKPTYAIRIGDNFPVDLIKTSNYKIIQTYNFGDCWPGSPISNGDIMFNETIAEKILNDFDQNKNKCKALFIHCSRGKNRSPAVGIALNEIFKLGYNTEHLIEKYPESTWYVYDLLVQTAKDLNLK